jgi:putative redox protein
MENTRSSKRRNTMDVSVNYLGGVKFEIAARGHRIISDQPRENGGADTGMTPPELLLASLGSCAAYYAAEYLRIRSLPVEGLQVFVHAEKALKPARLSMFQVRVASPHVNETHHDSLLRTVKHCLIHNTLLQPSNVDVIVETGSQANAA